MSLTNDADARKRKKRYVERPDVRANLLDAAEALIREEGYGAATARKIAERVGMKHQAVFYYFGSQDELLVAVFQRAADAQMRQLEAAIVSENPIRAMWNIHRDPDVTRLTLEFMALAIHNESIRIELAKNAEEVRRLEAGAVERHLRLRGIQPRLSPQLVSVLTNALARLLVQEATLGIDIGHAEAATLVDISMKQFEIMGATADPVSPIVDAMSSEMVDQSV